MKNQWQWKIVWAVAAVLAASSVVAAEGPVVPAIKMEAPVRPATPQLSSKPTAHAIEAKIPATVGDSMGDRNATDIAGVSLAAIKELSLQMKEKDIQLQVKDAEIAELQDHLKALSEGLSARLTALEQQQQRGVTESVSLKRAAGSLGE